MKVYKNKRAKEQIHDTYDELLTMWHIDLEEMDVPSSYGSTHVIRWGKKENPPLVLFHGVGDDSALMWLYNAAFLASYFSLYAVDTIGGPGKSRPNQNYNKDYDDVKWMDEILHAFHRDKVSLAGVSNGAYLVQLYTAHRPEKVIKAVCMAGSLPVESFGSLKTMMKVFLPEALFPTKKNAIKLLQKMSGKNSHVFTDNPTVVAHYHYLLRGFNNMAMRYHKIVSFTPEQIAEVRDKTLYLVGESDPFAQLGGKEVLLRYKMNAQFFHDVGHGINHELADTVNQLLVNYLLTP